MNLRKTVVAILAVAIVGVFVGMGIAHAQGGAPSGVVRWEYHFVFAWGGSPAEFNRLGAEGWQFVGEAVDGSYNVFKRRLP